MMGDGLLSLCWNNHRSTFCHVISTLRQKQRYSDVTLACEGRFYPVHKLVLSVCSEYFDDMLEQTPCKHPVIVLRDVQPEDLEALLSYMYEGMVSVAQSNLSRLIKTAEMLRIKGLAVADVDESLITADGRRVTSVTTTAIPIVNSVVRQTTRDGRISPQARKRRREENGVGNIQIANTYSTAGSDGIMTSTPSEFDGRHRQRTDIDRDHDSKDSIPKIEQVIVQEGLVTDDPTIDDSKTTAIIGTYGVVVSDGGTHTLVSHPQDQVITHRYESAQLTGNHQTQPLAEAVAEALAGPSGMQTWLGGTDLGPTSFTTVEAYTTEGDVQGTTTIQNLENVQTSTVTVTNANAVSATGATVVVEAVPVTATGTSSSTAREGNQLKCHYCNRATFRQTSDLKRHIRIHTGEKPFKCNFCPYKASRKDLLQAHLSKMHNNS